MANSTFSLALIGVVPAVCDAEAGEAGRLSTDDPLSEIGLDCGLADQSHLARLFRMIAGQCPTAWRRGRFGAPCEIN